jgi:hypothetical protein
MSPVVGPDGAIRGVEEIVATPMTPRERIVITLAVCLTVLVAGPMTVLAATGQLVNIVDPSNAGRQARVTAIGAVQVQARLGIPSGALNFQGTRENSGWVSLGSVLAPNGIAMTELTSYGTGASGIAIVSIQHAAVDDGASCTTPPSSPSLVRRMVVKVGTTEQLVFPSPIFIAAAPAGKRRCIFAQVTSVNGTTHYVAVSGYQYAP